MDEIDLLKKLLSQKQLIDRIQPKTQTQPVSNAKNKGGRPKAAPISDEQKNALHKLYYTDHNYFGREKLFQLAQSRGLNIPRAKVAEWLKEQHLSQIYAPTRKHKTVRISIQKKPFAQVSLDLIDMQNFEVRGYKYIFSAIDNFSKKTFCQPLKSKEDADVLKALKAMLRRSGFKNTESIRSDRGSEFTNNLFKQYLESKDIKQILSSAHNPASNGLVENWNRTIKGLIRRYITVTDNEDWVKILPKLVENYNNSRHITTGKTPNELSQLTDSAELETVNSKIRKGTIQRVGELGQKPKFSVGDLVRIKEDQENRDRLAFTYSRDIFAITKVYNPKSELTAPSYSLIDSDGDEVPGRFYETDLLKVSKVENELKLPEKWEISRLAEPVLLNNKKAYRVIWKGFRKHSDRTIELRDDLMKDAPKIVTAYERENLIDWKKVPKVRQ